MLEIMEKPLSELHPYERNPRKNKDAVKSVAASIQSFGFKVPIVVDTAGTIIAGHTRYLAAKKLGMKTVPCIIADDLTEDQIKAFRLADNRVAEIATWDQELLPMELADIVMPMTDFGFQTVSPDDFSTEFSLADGEKKPFQQMSITLHDRQLELIQAAIKRVYEDHEVHENFTNENHNGNGVYEIVRQWAEGKGMI